MAKSVVTSMKAAWETAKKDFKENTHPEMLKQDVKEVLDIAKTRASKLRKAPPSPQSKPSSSSKAIGPKVNQDVGGELLTHFKEEWAQIHHSTECASKTAAEMDVGLKQLNQSVSRSHVILSRCREEFQHLRDIVEALDEAQSKVEAISGLIEQVEQDLANYSLAKAELKTERQKHSILRQQEKDIVNERSKIEHLRKVLLNEQKLSISVKHEVESKELKERQQAFQELFDKQMADYRTRGEVSQPIGEVCEARERSASHLEEIVIEDKDGTASLHEFLSDVVLEDGKSPAGPGQEVEEGEGQAAEEVPAQTQEVAQEIDTPPI